MTLNLKTITTAELLAELKSRPDYTHVAGYTDEELEEILIEEDIIKTVLPRFKENIKNNFFLSEELESHISGIAINTPENINNDTLCTFFTKELANQISYAFDNFHYLIKDRKYWEQETSGKRVCNQSLLFINKQGEKIEVNFIVCLDDFEEGKIRIVFFYKRGIEDREGLNPVKISLSDALLLEAVSDLAETFYNKATNQKKDDN